MELFEIQDYLEQGNIINICIRGNNYNVFILSFEKKAEESIIKLLFTNGGIMDFTLNDGFDISYKGHIENPEIEEFKEFNFKGSIKDYQTVSYRDFCDILENKLYPKFIPYLRTYLNSELDLTKIGIDAILVKPQEQNQQNMQPENQIRKGHPRRIKYNLIFNSAKPFIPTEIEIVGKFVDTCLLDLSNPNQADVTDESIAFLSELDFFVIQETSPIKSESGDRIYVNEEGKIIPNKAQGRYNLVLGLEVYVSDNYNEILTPATASLAETIRMQIFNLLTTRTKGDLVKLLNNYTLVTISPNFGDFCDEDVRVQPKEDISNKSDSVKEDEDVFKFKLNIIFNSRKPYSGHDIEPIMDYVVACLNYLQNPEQKVEVSEIQEVKLQDKVLYITQDLNTIESESGAKLYFDDEGGMIPDASKGGFNLVFELTVKSKHQRKYLRNEADFILKVKQMILELILKGKCNSLIEELEGLEISSVQTDQRIILGDIAIGESKSFIEGIDCEEDYMKEFNDFNNEEYNVTLEDELERIKNLYLTKDIDLSRVLDEPNLTKEENRIRLIYKNVLNDFIKFFFDNIEGNQEPSNYIVDSEALHENPQTNTIPKNVVRPPYGIIPKKFFVEQVQQERLNQLRGAIARYYEAGYKINTEWIEEYNELIDSLNTKDEKLVQSDINESDEEELSSFTNFCKEQLESLVQTEKTETYQEAQSRRRRERNCWVLAPENETTELPQKKEFKTTFDLVLTSDVPLPEHAKKKIQRMTNTYMLKAGIPKLIYNNHPVFNKATYMDLLVEHHSKKTEENLSIDEIQPTETKGLQEYLKTPKRIKAIQWTGDNFDKIQQVFKDKVNLINNRLLMHEGNVSCEVELTDFIYEDNGEFTVMSQKNFIKMYEKFEEQFQLIGALAGSIIITPIELEAFKKRGVKISEALNDIQKDIY